MEQIEVGREMGAACGVVLPSVAAAGLLFCVVTGCVGPLLTFFFFVGVGHVCLQLVILLEFYIPFLRIREVLQTPVNYNYNYHHSNGQGSYLIEASQQAIVQTRALVTSVND